MICGKISASISLSCATPISPGVKDKIILFNLEDLASYTRNVTNPNIIEDITLVATKVAYQYDGKNNSFVPKMSLVKKTFSELYDHEISFSIFDNSPTIKAQIEALAGARVIAIVENYHRGATGNAAFELYGTIAGLVLTVAERSPADQDSTGAFSLTLKSHETSQEPNLPSTIFITDYATTKTMIDGLLTP